VNGLCTKPSRHRMHENGRQKAAIFRCDEQIDPERFESAHFQSQMRLAGKLPTSSPAATL